MQQSVHQSPALVSASLFQVAPVTQELPFIVRVAGSDSDFAALCAFRCAAYSRHDYTPSLAGRLVHLDEGDRQAFLMIALDKASGRCIGTLRISLTTRGETPMAPYEPLGVIQGQHHAYVDRFAVHVADNHAMVRQALIKAMWLLVCGEELPWIVCSALAPLARLYQGVGLRPIPGAEKGFRHPRLHDSALYYMRAGRSVEFFGSIQRANPERANWFGILHHPDIQMPWPPLPDWIQQVAAPGICRSAGGETQASVMPGLPPAAGQGLNAAGRETSWTT